jgi:hypothetical protein
MKLKKDLSDQLIHIESTLTDEQKLNASRTVVSGWSVNQHIDHLLKVDQSILKGIIANERKSDKRINLIGRASLFFGFIPRGRAKSPERVVGYNRSADELRRSLEEVRMAIEQIQPGKFEESVIEHPVFGGLNSKEWLRFLAVHHLHHWKIVKEIWN